MKIALVISSLGAGGAERVLTGMANYLAERHQVLLLTLASVSADFYPLHPAIVRVGLDLQYPTRNPLHAAQTMARRVLAIRTQLDRFAPDAVISFVDKTNVLTCLAVLGKPWRLIISERSNPIYYQIKSVWSAARNFVYRAADMLVVQTDSLQDWATAVMRTVAKVAVIPNSLDQGRLAQIQRAAAAVQTPDGQLRVISLGRLSREKGHDLLIAAFAEVAATDSAWRLEIIGDGPLRQTLQEQAVTLGIAERVQFHGQLQNPFDLLATADIFVLPSRTEGFPNVLLEAMAMGRACISFDCQSGPRDLIVPEVNGVLVPPEDSTQLATALLQLMAAPALRQQLGQQARAVCEKFSDQHVMQQWEALL